MSGIENEIKSQTWMYERYSCTSQDVYKNNGEHSPYFFEVLLFPIFSPFSDFFLFFHEVAFNLRHLSNSILLWDSIQFG
jgi:hypothetical protein